MAAGRASEDGRSDRQLRMFTIAAMIPALVLLIPSGVFTYQALPAIGLVPMAMSAALGAAVVTDRKISTSRRAVADIVIATLLLFVLVPRYDTNSLEPQCRAPPPSP